MGKQEKGKRWLPELTTKAKILFGLVIFIFVAAIVVFATTTILRQLSLGGVQDYQFGSMSTDERKKEARNAVINAIDSDDAKAADGVYKQAIAAEPDGAKKVEIAIDYSNTLSNDNQEDKAIQVAKDAEPYNSDKYRITDWLARLHAKLGRYDEARVYYEAAGKLIDSPTNIGSYSKKYYELRAADMKARAEKQ